MFLFHYEAVVKKKLARAVDTSGTRVLTSKMVQMGRQEARFFSLCGSL